MAAPHTVGIDSGRPGAFWAACRDCQWYGPVRDSFAAAQHDQDAHIVITELGLPRALPGV